MSTSTSRTLTEIVEQLRADRTGGPAPYLADVPGVDVDVFTAATCTVDGDLEVAGEGNPAFALQSIAKAFVYAIVLEERGLAAVLDRVGVEPSGEAFNEMSIRAGGRPFHPPINAGALMVHGMIPGADEHERIDLIRRPRWPTGDGTRSRVGRCWLPTPSGRPCR